MSDQAQPCDCGAVTDGPYANVHSRDCPSIQETDLAEKYARLLVKLRDHLAIIVDGIEDEGDRAYFGSTNDADELRRLWHRLDEIKWLRIMGREIARR